MNREEVFAFLKSTAGDLSEYAKLHNTDIEKIDNRLDFARFIAEFMEGRGLGLDKIILFSLYLGAEDEAQSGDLLTAKIERGKV